MQQPKISLKLTMLLMVICLITVGCQIDDTQNEPAANQAQDQQGLKITMTTWQHFSEQSPKASQRIAAIEEQNALARNTESELYGFVVDTSRVQIIEQEGFTTYAFSAIRQQPTPGIMENYLYKQNNDGTYQQYLLGYYCTVDLDGNIQYTADDLIITPIDDPSLLSRDSCYPEFVQVDTVTVCTVGMTCYGPGADGNHTSASECSCENTPSTCYKPGSMVCNDRPIFGWSNCPGGLPEDNPFDPSGPSNSGGTPTTTYTAPDGTVYTVLVPHPALYEVLACINGNNGQSSLNDPTTLNVDAQMIATMNAYWKPMSIYLNQNQCSEEAQAFALAVIEAGPDAEVDYANKIIKDPTFIGTKADCVLNALISSNNNLFRTTSQAFTNQNSKFKIKFTAAHIPTDSGDARTFLPDDNGIIVIKINLARVANSNALDLARIIFHETIHAELHRIKLSNNARPNPLPQDQYNWYVKMWNDYEDYYNGNQNYTATAAEHNYMALYRINNIAQGLRQFDNNTHPLANYKYFAWEGLEDYGTENGYITSAELSALANLTTIVHNDSHTNPCD